LSLALLPGAPPPRLLTWLVTLRLATYLAPSIRFSSPLNSSVPRLRCPWPLGFSSSLLRRRPALSPVRITAYIVLLVPLLGLLLPRPSLPLGFPFPLPLGTPPSASRYSPASSLLQSTFGSLRSTGSGCPNWNAVGLVSTHNAYQGNGPIFTCHGLRLDLCIRVVEEEPKVV